MRVLPPSDNVVRAAVFCALLVVQLLAVPADLDAHATELNASYSNFDVQGFQEDTAPIARDVDALDRLVKILESEEVSAERAERHQETISVAKMLADGRRRFERLYIDQADDMADEIARAEKDGKIRRIAAGLNFAASLLEFASQFEGRSPSDRSAQEAQEDAAPELSGSNPNPNAPEGSRSVEWKAERKIRIRIDGEWKTIDVRKMIHEEIVYPMSRDGTPASGTIGDSLDQLADRFGALTGELPLIECNDSVRGCFPAGPAPPGDFGDGRDFDSRVSYPEEATPIAPLQRPPTRAEKNLFRSISSMALDLTPFVGTLKSAAEVVTGRDPVTGQNLPRAVAVAGFVLSAVPGGKLWIKTGGSTALKYGPKIFRHYTSRNGSNGILATGIIKANNDGKVFAGARVGKPLDPNVAPIRYELDSVTKGRDVVEFQLPESTRVISTTNRQGVTEYVIEGDVPLGPGAKVLQRR